MSPKPINVLREPRFPMQRSLNSHVASELGAQILQGRFKPGDAIPDEGTLGSHFGVSRTVIREALKVLSAKGLVDSRPRRGTQVLPTDRWNRLDPDLLIWQEGAEPTQGFLQRLIEVRRIVEPPAAELAAGRATAEELDAIEDALERMREGLDEVEAFIQADILFHSAVITASHNEFLQPFNHVIRTAMTISLRVTNRQADKNKDSLVLHRSIHQAIRNRKPSEAGKAMQSHLDDTWARIERRLKGEGRHP